MTNIDKALQEWILKNKAETPLFGWLDARDGAIAIIPIPTEDAREFIGSGYKEVTYDFMVRASFDASATTDDLNTENMATLRQWQDWIDAQELAGNYPDFGAGYSGFELKNLSNMPSVAGVDPDSMRAVYQFPARLIYLKEI